MIPAVVAVVVGVGLFAGGLAAATLLPTEPPAEVPSVQVHAAPVWLSYATLGVTSFNAMAVCLAAFVLLAIKRSL